MDKKVQNTYTLLARALLLYLCSQVCCQQCSRPCQCPSPVPACPDGVALVLDGCGCCQVCARQKGEACTDILVCDEQHGLECDYSASLPGKPGECVSQEELGCEHNGVSYQEGEVFQPSCNTQCKCAGGGVTCVPLCSEDVRLPSSDCPYPQRVQLPGKCCKEWVCENIDNSMQQDGPGAYSDALVWTALPGYKASPILKCIHHSTEWSACSQTCGQGISTRMSNENAACLFEHQMRLCTIRPCKDSPQLIPACSGICKRSYKPNVPTYLVHEGCYSTQVYWPLYCGFCNNGQCTPFQSDTITVNFQCPWGHMFQQAVMMIRSCVCHYNYPYSYCGTYRKPAL